MASTFFLAPIPLWVEVDQNGDPAGGCIMYPRSTLDHSQIKPVYMDSAGVIPWPMDADGGIVFLSNGTQGPFYWEDKGTDEFYYLEIYNANGQLLQTIDGYPVVGAGGGGPIVTIGTLNNHIINGQFQFHSIPSPLAPVPTGETAVQPTSQYGGWYFFKNIVGSTDSISVARPSLSSTSPPKNPLGIFKYSCTVAGAGTRIDLIYRTHDVKTFSNEIIKLQFQAQASGAAPPGVQGEIIIRQFFGTGGAPSGEVVSVPITFVFPNGVFAPVTQQLNVASVAGKNLGTNNDDTFELIIRFPLGSVGDYQISNVMLVEGTVIPTDYIYDTYIETYYKLSSANQAFFRVGDTVYSYNNTPRVGWLAFSDGQTIGGPSSIGATYTTNYLGFSLFDLYSVWWDIAGGLPGQPVIGGGAGATALADWNAGKKITVPSINGRVAAAFQGGALGVGEEAGLDSKPIPLGALPNHDHQSTLPLKSPGIKINYASGGNVLNVASQVSTGYTTSLTGNGDDFDVRQKTTYLLCFVKL